MIIECKDEAATKEFGRKLGAAVRGGDVIELVGDVGAGKTTLTKGVAVGMDIIEMIQSPTFTISRVYDSPRGMRLAHYDFYRLDDPGVMQVELHEAVHDPLVVTIIEWGDVVSHVLPNDHLTIRFEPGGENERAIELTAHGDKSRRILEALS